MLLLKIRILEYQIMVYYGSIKEVPHAPILHRPVQISLILIVITNKIIVRPYWIVRYIPLKKVAGVLLNTVPLTN